MRTVIALEGIDGAGKTTQAKLLVDALRGRGVDAMHTGPFLTSYGKQVRDLYLASLETAPTTQVYLLASAVHQLVDELRSVPPNHIIILDRYVHSTYVYHGEGRGVGVTRVQAIYEHAAEDLRPTVVLLLDIAPEVAQSRLQAARDRLEALPVDFHRGARQSYLKLAETDASFTVLDASKSASELHKDVLDVVLHYRRSA